MAPIKDSKEHPLQAVILMDNFDPKLALFQKPWGLVPLVGAALVDYTLEFVSRTEIRHVSVVACQNVERVKAHLKSWDGRFDSVSVIVAETCHSFGDVLRELDRRALIKGDFLMLQAGTLCSSSLRSVIEEYRQRRVKNKDCIMTILAREQSRDHPLRLASPTSGDIAMLLEDKTGKLTFFQQLSTRSEWKKLNISTMSFAEEAELRLNLADCQMALCSPQVPPLFSDNFDFQTKQDLVKEILTNEEIHGHMAHVHILPNTEYAATVSDFGTYLEIGKQVLQRWSYPLTPDNMSVDGTVHYLCYPRFQYLPENGTSVAREGLGRGVLVGPGTKIGANSRIVNSIVGNNCVIGDNVILENCVLWDDVHVGSGSRAQDSILCTGVTVDTDCRLEPRCILRPGVSLSHGVTVASATVVSREKPDVDDDEILSAPAAKLNLDKQGTDLCFWRLRSDQVPKTADFWPEKLSIPTTVGDSGGKSSRSGTVGTSSGGDDMESTDSETDSAPDDDDFPMDKASPVSPGSRTPSTPSVCGSNLEQISGIALTDEAKQFYKEVFESLDRGIAEKLSCDDLKTEVNCSKFAYNVSMEELHMLLVRAVMEIIFKTVYDTTTDVMGKIKPVLEHLGPLFLNYFDAEDAQGHALAVFEEFALLEPKFCGVLMKTIHFLYEKEILLEEAILSWFGDLEGEAEMKLKAKLEPFISWLQEAEEDSDSE